jgi:hypothetical protein
MLIESLLSSYARLVRFLAQEDAIAPERRIIAGKEEQ